MIQRTLRFNYLVVIFFLCSSCNIFAETPPKKKVIFLSPTHQESPFFKQSIAIMHEAAEDLNLDLEIVYGEDLVIVSEQAEAVLKRKELPDYLVLTSLRGITEKLMRDADRLGIHTLLFNAGIGNETNQQFRHGAQPLKRWIGQVLPNDQQASQLLAQKLLDASRAAKKHNDNGLIEFIAINGSMRSPASNQREIGLNRFVEQHPEVKVQQLIYTNWTQDEARQKAGLLFKRFENITVVWTAADSLAIGVTQAIEDFGATPGKDTFTAGIDWLPTTQDYIQKGSILGSVGGHSFDGAWALVVIYDHAQGAVKEFVDERTAFHWIDKNNLASMRKVTDPAVWRRLDFREFSKTANGGQPYRFGVERILESKHFAEPQARKIAEDSSE